MNLAIVYRMLGRYSESVNALRKCLEEAPEDYRINMYLAFDYYESGDSTNASYYMNKAVSLYEKLPETERQSADPEAVSALYVLKRKILEGGS